MDRVLRDLLIATQHHQVHVRKPAEQKLRELQSQIDNDVQVRLAAILLLKNSLAAVFPDPSEESERGADLANQLQQRHQERVFIQAKLIEVIRSGAQLPKLVETQTQVTTARLALLTWPRGQWESVFAELCQCILRLSERKGQESLQEFHSCMQALLVLDLIVTELDSTVIISVLRKLQATLGHVLPVICKCWQAALQQFSATFEPYAAAVFGQHPPPAHLAQSAQRAQSLLKACLTCMASVISSCFSSVGDEASLQPMLQSLFSVLHSFLRKLFEVMKTMSARQQAANDSQHALLSELDAMLSTGTEIPGSCLRWNPTAFKPYAVQFAELGLHIITSLDGHQYSASSAFYSAQLYCLKYLQRILREDALGKPVVNQVFKDDAVVGSLALLLCQKYFTLSRHDLESWQDSPETFLHEEEMSDMKVRPASMLLFCYLFLNRTEIVKSTIAQLLQECLQPVSTAQLEDLNTVIRMDATYSVVGVVYDEVTDMLPFEKWIATQASAMNASLATNNNAPHTLLQRVLQRRFCWLFGELAGLIPGAVRAPILQYLLQCASAQRFGHQPRDILVRVTACSGIHELLSSECTRIRVSNQQTEQKASGFPGFTSASALYSANAATPQQVQSELFQAKFLKPAFDSLHSLLMEAEMADTQEQVLNTYAQVVRSCGAHCVEMLPVITHALPRLWQRFVETQKAILLPHLLECVRALVEAVGATDHVNSPAMVDLILFCYQILQRCFARALSVSDQLASDTDRLCNLEKSPRSPHRMSRTFSNEMAAHSPSRRRMASYDDSDVKSLEPSRPPTLFLNLPEKQKSGSMAKVLAENILVPQAVALWRSMLQHQPDSSHQAHHQRVVQAVSTLEPVLKRMMLASGVTLFRDSLLTTYAHRIPIEHYSYDPTVRLLQRLANILSSHVLLYQQGYAKSHASSISKFVMQVLPRLELHLVCGLILAKDLTFRGYEGSSFAAPRELLSGIRDVCQLVHIVCHFYEDHVFVHCQHVFSNQLKFMFTEVDYVVTQNRYPSATSVKFPLSPVIQEVFGLYLTVLMRLLITNTNAFQTFMSQMVPSRIKSLRADSVHHVLSCLGLASALQALHLRPVILRHYLKDAFDLYACSIDSLQKEAKANKAVRNRYKKFTNDAESRRLEALHQADPLSPPRLIGKNRDPTACANVCANSCVLLTARLSQALRACLEECQGSDRAGLLDAILGAAQAAGARHPEMQQTLGKLVASLQG